MTDNFKQFLRIGVATALLFAACTGCRRADNTWRVRFFTKEGAAAVDVSCAKPQRHMTILFPESVSSNRAEASVQLLTGKESLPDGKIVFADMTWPPGRVTMTIQGHTIDVMKRGVIIDKRECAWGKDVML